jgi:hypothetical protein
MLSGDRPHIIILIILSVRIAHTIVDAKALFFRYNSQTKGWQTIDIFPLVKHNKCKIVSHTIWLQTLVFIRAIDAICHAARSSLKGLRTIQKKQGTA